MLRNDWKKGQNASTARTTSSVAKTTTSLELSPPDPDWLSSFESVRDELTSLLGPAALRVEHIGGTAVPGLLAKYIAAKPAYVEQLIARARSWNDTLERGAQ